MRPSEKLASILALFIFVLSGIGLYITAKHTYGTEIPVAGGEITEGVIGYARFINPVLAFSDADKDLVSLVYSGLLKASPEGDLEGDIAESWSVSEDGLVYTVKLKPNVTFHDGKALTTDDVEFTILRTVDPLVKSPKAANWTGVSIEKVNPFEIKFTLKKPYAPFAENLTIGILPKHIWESVAPEAFDVSEYNKEPVGSGPYKIKLTKQDRSGLYEYYELEPFEKYALGKPYIQTVTLAFFKNEESAVKAFNDGKINFIGGLSPEYAQQLDVKKSGETPVIEIPLPRIFALFFNQNTDPVLINKEVRKALEQSIDRDALIDQILKGYGSAITGPVPLGINAPALSSLTSSVAASATASSTATTSVADTARSSAPADSAAQLSADEKIALAKKTLEDAGWKLNADGVYEKKIGDKTQPLTFTISTSNSPELTSAAEILRTQWKAIGADIKVEVYESSDLTQKIIRPRKYGALLFGQVVGRDIDLYPFWHSSQRVDPGLNIALYANIKADRALELARSSGDIIKRTAARLEFETEIKNDIPAIFLFSPDYVYMTNGDTRNIKLQNITEPSERFMNIHEWFAETDYSWKKVDTPLNTEEKK